MSAYYVPIFRRQIGDPTTTRDGYICTMESGAMALDYHTLGSIQVWGGVLDAHDNRSDVDPTHPTNLNDAQAAWAYFGQTLVVRAGRDWANVKAALAEGRAVIIQGDYDQMGGYTCQASFLGDHAILLLPSASAWAVEADPLCSGFKVVPEATIRAYAEKLARAKGIYPGLFFAVSQAHPLIAASQEAVMDLVPVQQAWTGPATGSGGPLRVQPDRNLGISEYVPPGQQIISFGEWNDPATGNNWRFAAWPVGSRTGRWFLRYGPGVAPDHDMIAGPILTGGADCAAQVAAATAPLLTRISTMKAKVAATATDIADD